MSDAITMSRVHPEYKPLSEGEVAGGLAVHGVGTQSAGNTKFHFVGSVAGTEKTPTIEGVGVGSAVCEKRWLVLSAWAESGKQNWA
jgi:hypothetical protein